MFPDDLSRIQLCFKTGLGVTLSEKLDYLCNCESGISNVCKAVEGHYLQAMKIVHQYTSGRFDWLITREKQFYFVWK